MPTLLAVLDPPVSTRMEGNGSHLIVADPSAWELRSLLLLWFSLLLTVPFPLKSFDAEVSSSVNDMATCDISSILPHTAAAFPDSSPAIISQARTAQQALRISAPLLFAAGKEGEFAALILARLMGRGDVKGGLEPVLEWIGREAQEGQERQSIFVSRRVSALSANPTDLSFRLGRSAHERLVVLVSPACADPP